MELNVLGLVTPGGVLEDSKNPTLVMCYSKDLKADGWLGASA